MASYKEEKFVAEFSMMGKLINKNGSLVIENGRVVGNYGMNKKVDASLDDVIIAANRKNDLMIWLKDGERIIISGVKNGKAALKILRSAISVNLQNLKDDDTYKNVLIEGILSTRRDRAKHFVISLVLFAITFATLFAFTGAMGEEVTLGQYFAEHTMLAIMFTLIIVITVGFGLYFSKLSGGEFRVKENLFIMYDALTDENYQASIERYVNKE